MFSPKDVNKRWIGDFDVYIDDETLPAFYCRAEKPIAFTAEYAEFLEGIPQILTFKDLIRFGMTIAIIILEWEIDILQLARGGVTSEDASYRSLHFGTDYSDPPTHKYKFVGNRADAKIIELTLYKGKVSEMGDIPTGGTDYNEVPATIEALVDTTIADTTRNLARFRIEK